MRLLDMSDNKEQDFYKKPKNSLKFANCPCPLLVPGTCGARNLFRDARKNFPPNFPDGC